MNALNSAIINGIFEQQLFALFDAEAVLLVSNDQRKIFEPDIVSKKCMCSDNDTRSA